MAALQPAVAAATRPAAHRVQRKCACGARTASAAGTCPACEQKKRLQRKLAIGASGDPLEYEADRVADLVMAGRTPEPNGIGLPRINRFIGSAIGIAPDSVDDALASPGAPLEPVLRQSMEERFGYDFSQVRVHCDAIADQSARALNAHAYTAGHHLVFADRRFAPTTDEGRRLLAHELTHVVQQSGDVAARPVIVARQPAKSKELAQTLAKKLDKKHDEVLKALEKLTTKELDDLEAATTVLSKKQAEQLVRAIRFTRHKPAVMPTQSPVTVVDAGTAEPKAKAAKVGAGAVEFRRGVSYKSGAGDSKEAYSLTYKGTDAADMRWLQFIYREVVSEFPAATKGGPRRKVPLRKKLTHGYNVYHLTTDPAKRNWTTDSPARSAFYEENTTVNRSASALTMFDAPSAMQSDVAALFKSTPAPDRVVSHFHATTYLVRGMDVLYRAEVDVTWNFTDATQPTALVTATKGKAGSIDSAHRARLAYQYPELDYLAGPAIDAPGRTDPFDPVTNLTPTGSISEKDWPTKQDLDKFEDIAAIAHAEWIEDVRGMSAVSINNAKDYPKGVKPGLNYSAALPVEAEAGYVDASDNYTNPLIPVQTTGKLPRVAIILGPKAFARDKAYAVATLRHEMEHAAHHQLAIGWLLKWRDARSGKTFKEWLLNEHKSKRISEVDFALVMAGVTGNLAATETLAWTEGFVTASPFLPAKPAFSLMTGGNYPAAISALKGAGQFFNRVPSLKVQEAALARIHGFSCKSLSQTQRDALKEWIAFLLDPKSLNPTSGDKATVAVMEADFKPLKGFLDQVLAMIKKACPK